MLVTTTLKQWLILVPTVPTTIMGQTVQERLAWQETTTTVALVWRTTPSWEVRGHQQKGHGEVTICNSPIAVTISVASAVSETSWPLNVGIQSRAKVLCNLSVFCKRTRLLQFACVECIKHSVESVSLAVLLQDRHLSHSLVLFPPLEYNSQLYYSVYNVLEL